MTPASGGFSPPTLPLPDGYVLRPIRAEDAAAWFGCVADPRVHGPTSWNVRSVDELAARIDALRAGRAGAWRWVIARRDDDALVGTCGAARWDLDGGVAEVAYELTPGVWGRGLATAAVAAFLAEARVAGFGRVEAHTWVDNLPSQRVLARCGFARDARLPAFRDCRGDLRDFWRYTLPLRAEGGLR